MRLAYHGRKWALLSFEVTQITFMPLHELRKVPLLRSFGPQVRDDTLG